MRLPVVEATFTVGALLTVGVSSGCAGPSAAADRAAQTSVTAAAGGQGIPGTDPAIQRWFLANGVAKVAFNNALLRAERGVAAGNAGECTPLSVTSQTLNKALPRLAALSPAGQRLAAAIQPTLTTFGAAATACLAKDFAAATTALSAGIVQQADAQASVDEILDGGQ